MNWWATYILIVISPFVLYIWARITFAGVFRSYFQEKSNYEKEMGHA